MFLSMRWLSRHVDLTGLSAQDVAESLTIHTAEVEGVERFAPALSDVVVGHVLERGQHPQADRLSLCKVDVGPAKNGEPLQIVCGAPNVDAGQRVAVARIGTVLPGGLKLKRSKIRGVESQGMICSKRELELGDEHTGIWVLPGEPTIGQPVDEALDLVDHVIEIENKSLTHRPDLWGHRGIAGELAAIHGRELLPLDLTLPATGAGEPYPVRVESDHCPRYLGLAIDDVRVETSPLWLEMLLLAAGQRPLDLLVDLSNFVMLDLGQPNHLFDRNRLSPEGIVVRDARPGERMTTLDEVERELAPSDMLICSGDEPVALAGVMGGEGSKVNPATTELLLEVASFDATPVRRTAARLGLRTDASTRFEKSLDPTLPEKAAAHLVRTLATIQPDVRLPCPMGDAGTWSDPARRVALRPGRLRAVLGAEVPDDEIERILVALGFGVTRTEPSRWDVDVPSARATKDVGIEEDLIEEVGRMHGYGNVPEASFLAPVEPVARDERRELVRALGDALAGGARFRESMTHTFLAEESAGLLGVEAQPFVRVVNPQAEGLERVRRAVLPSLLATLRANRRHHEEIRLFEVGKGYRPEAANERGEPAEDHELALLWMGPRPAGGARFDEALAPRLQAVLEEAVRSAARALPDWERAQPSCVPFWAHPGRCLRAANGERTVALLAPLEPGLARALGLTGELDGEVVGAQLSIDALLEGPEARRAFRQLARFPGTKVDVALGLPEAVSAAQAREAIEAAGKGRVEQVELFDLYRGESLGAGRKSLAFHVLLQAPDKTLSEGDVAKFLARLERGVERLGGELRRD